MKKLLPIIVLAFVAISTAFSQGCLPEGIVFETQDQIDSFQTNYPGCTEIEGDMKIYQNQIIDLSGLSILKVVRGILSISHADSINSLFGLHNIDTIVCILQDIGTHVIQKM